ncbi:hypothetical protein FRC17_008263, partial [Serendipita sp. 399]
PTSNSGFSKQAVSIETASTEGERRKVGVEEPYSVDAEVAQDASRVGDPAQTLEKADNRKSSHLITYPDEALSLIFESYVDILGNPWTLMQVCRRWRHVATHARRIWSRILIIYQAPIDFDFLLPCAKRRYQGYEICNTVLRLSSALARAAGGPLNIRFKLIGLSVLDSSAEAETFSRECVDLLRSSQAYLRIRLLDINIARASWIDSLCFDNFEFIALESAWVGRSTPSLCRQIQLTAQRIHALALHKNLGENFSWDLQMFPDLRNLKVWGRGSRDPELYRLLRGGTHLVDLSLHSMEVSGEGPLSFLSLQMLRLDDVQFGCRVNLPNLRSLKMSFASVLSTGEESIDLPFLVSLELYGYALSHKVRIRAPALSTFQLRLYSRTGKGVPHLLDWLEETIKPAFSTLRSMELEGEFNTSTPFADLLDRCVSLEKLHISRTRTKKSFFEALGGCLHPRKSGSALQNSPIVPSLKAFHLDLTDVGRVSTRAAPVKWARMAVRARRQGGYPLNEASARTEASGPPI